MSEINNYQWPTDEKFQKFARLLADKVTTFINNGGKIVPINEGVRDPKCNCPMGVYINNVYRYPYGCFRYGWGDLDWFDLRDFIDGFDNQVRNNAYGQLGFAYRKRFGY